MSGKEQEPVIEQSDDSKESTVSVPVEEAPIASTKNEETVPDVPANNIKEELNYLSSKLFSDIREVSIDDLINSDVVEEVSVEDEERYLSTFSDISEKEIISGRVIGMNEKEVLIDIGFKSEGIISRNEFNEDALPEVGEKLDVFLEKMEDESGKTVLSKEKADFFRRWVELRNIHETGEIITGRIVRRIKGGMVVDLNGVQAFLPGSQIDVRPVKDFDRFIDTDLDLRVVKFNEFRKNMKTKLVALICLCFVSLSWAQESEDFLKYKMPNRLLPKKICRTCKLSFKWRKKWRNNWNSVLYCSERCRRNKKPLS